MDFSIRRNRFQLSPDNSCPPSVTVVKIRSQSENRRGYGIIPGEWSDRMPGRKGRESEEEREEK